MSQFLYVRYAPGFQPEATPLPIPGLGSSILPPKISLLAVVLAEGTVSEGQVVFAENPSFVEEIQQFNLKEVRLEEAVDWLKQKRPEAVTFFGKVGEEIKNSPEVPFCMIFHPEHGTGMMNP